MAALDNDFYEQKEGFRNDIEVAAQPLANSQTEFAVGSDEETMNWLLDNHLTHLITPFQRFGATLDILLFLENLELKEFAKHTLNLNVIDTAKLIKAVNRVKSFHNSARAMSNMNDGSYANVSGHNQCHDAYNDNNGNCNASRAHDCTHGKKDSMGSKQRNNRHGDIINGSKDPLDEDKDNEHDNSVSREEHEQMEYILSKLMIVTDRYTICKDFNKMMSNNSEKYNGIKMILSKYDQIIELLTQQKMILSKHYTKLLNNKENELQLKVFPNLTKLRKQILAANNNYAKLITSNSNNDNNNNDNNGNNKSANFKKIESDKIYISIHNQFKKRKKYLNVKTLDELKRELYLEKDQLLVDNFLNTIEHSCNDFLSNLIESQSHESICTVLNTQTNTKTTQSHVHSDHDHDACTRESARTNKIASTNDTDSNGLSCSMCNENLVLIDARFAYGAIGYAWRSCHRCGNKFNNSNNNGNNGSNNVNGSNNGNCNIFHCPKEFCKEHITGYDLCQECGIACLKEFEPSNIIEQSIFNAMRRVNV